MTKVMSKEDFFQPFGEHAVEQREQKQIMQSRDGTKNEVIKRWTKVMTMEMEKKAQIQKAQQERINRI